MNSWKWENRDGIDYITVEKWMNEGVSIAFSSRHKGRSEAQYNSLNLGLHVGDTKERVLDNRRKYMGLFNSDVDDVVCCQQVHGNRVVKVDYKDKGRGALDYTDVIKDCDAMITDSPGLSLLTFYADCIPIYFYDPRNRAIGLAHSGWKGTMGRIGAELIKAMHNEFSSLSSDINVFIGPGIGSCCFEIQADLLDKVRSEFKDLHDIIYHRNGKYYWDLHETNMQLLLAAGVKEENLIVCRLCTACNVEDFFSYRKEQGHTGRMGALIGLDY